MMLSILIIAIIVAVIALILTYYKPKISPLLYLVPLFFVFLALLVKGGGFVGAILVIVFLLIGLALAVAVTVGIIVALILRKIRKK
ncbi:MAG: hypothetical protein DRJ38_08920 [Thermoprotei archaeon]|nr:MAG: hypothetical protein DRJ38_08920 [Thermoprotei archaeon]